MLGGRAFLTVQETSVKQDHLIFSLIRQGGIDQAFIGPNDSPEEFGRRLVESALKSGVALQLLGCLLVPESAVPRGRWGRRGEPGLVWSLEMADDTTAYLGELRDRDDKAMISSLIYSVLISFFDLGIVSCYTSKTSSSEAVPATEQESASPLAAVDHGQGSS